MIEHCMLLRAVELQTELQTFKLPSDIFGAIVFLVFQIFLLLLYVIYRVCDATLPLQTISIIYWIISAVFLLYTMFYLKNIHIYKLHYMLCASPRFKNAIYLAPLVDTQRNLNALLYNIHTFVPGSNIVRIFICILQIILVALFYHIFYKLKDGKFEWTLGTIYFLIKVLYVIARRWLGKQIYIYYTRSKTVDGILNILSTPTDLDLIV